MKKYFEINNTNLSSNTEKESVREPVSQAELELVEKIEALADRESVKDDNWDDFDDGEFEGICDCDDDYFSLDNIIKRHPDQYATIMTLHEEFDNEILEDILFDLSKDD